MSLPAAARTQAGPERSPHGGAARAAALAAFCRLELACAEVPGPPRRVAARGIVAHPLAPAGSIVAQHRRAAALLDQGAGGAGGAERADLDVEHGGLILRAHRRVSAVAVLSEGKDVGAGPVRAPLDH